MNLGKFVARRPRVARAALRARTFLALGLVALAVAQERLLSEPLGPSSRRTAMVISEIAYAPASRADGRDLEFIELYNSQPWLQDLSGFRLAGDVQFTFPTNTVLSSNAFVVVARRPADVRAVHGISHVLGPYAPSLPDGGGTIRLEHRNGGVLLEVRYRAEAPWPASPAGTGHSLVLARPSYGERDVAAWAPSAFVGGSPGTWEPVATDPRRATVINEFLASGTGGARDFVELLNPSPGALDLSGCVLTDEPFNDRFVVPPRTVIPPGGFVVFDDTQLGFGLSRRGEALYLWNPERTAVLDAVRFGPQADGFSSGRFPNGANGFRPLAQPTPGHANARVLLPEIVINEIMYDPISGEREDEYVELHNPSASPVNVGGWRFSDGIEFELPASAVVPARGYLVVAKSIARLTSNYPNLNSANTVGDYQGSLSNDGERLVLERADGTVVEEVTYGVGGQWGRWAHGGGSSLERTDVRGDPDLATNWRDSDETGKAPWTKVEFTGTLDGCGIPFTLGLRSLYVVLLGAGECLLDNVEVKAEDGANLVANSTFQTGLTGWLGQGNHEHVQLEAAGYDDGASLRLSASGRGSTGPNRLRCNLGAGLRTGHPGTLRAQVRWLRGCPEILLRLIGNQLEAYGRMEVPVVLGTPGLPNSQAMPNAGPAISAVRHEPVLPASDEPILVTAQVDDPDGLDDVTLNYRIDPGTNFVSVAMSDDGLGGDLVADDGVYSASLPGQAARALVAFHMVAVDRAASPAQTVFPPDAPSRECLVRVGETLPAGQFGTYRVWMTRSTLMQWNKREPASDEPLDVTFAYDEARAVYGVGAYYAGNPISGVLNYNGPIGESCDYTLVFPEDDRLLGVTDVRLSWPGLAGRYADPTLQTEQAAFWLAEQMGLPFNHRRYIHLFINGSRRGRLIEDAQKPNGDFVEEWFPDASDGRLFKLKLHSEQNDAGRERLEWVFGQALNQIRVPDNTPRERAYRWIWNQRATGGSQNDLRSVYQLVEAFNLTDSQGYTARVTALVDVDQWMRTFAVERFVGNWDSFGYADDQNMFFYQPPQGKWHLAIWDVDLMMGRKVNGTWIACAPTDSIFRHGMDWAKWDGSGEPEKRFLRHPAFRRIYLHSLQQLVDGPALHLRELLDAKAAAFTANSIPIDSPEFKLSEVHSFVTNRTDSIRKQLAPYRAPFSITTASPTIATSTEPVVLLTGTASFEVVTLNVNGARLPVEWNTTTNWSVKVPLTAATNLLTVTGYDASDNPIADALGTVTVIYTGTGLRTRQPVVFNEWMAANTTFLDPADGDADDWFELYNPNPFDVDLFGYRLTDHPTNTAKFVIPWGWTIPAGGYLLLWADEEGSQTVTSTNLHVNFKLSSDGEELALYDPAGELSDAITFGVQSTGTSEGRWPDGAAAEFRRFTVPTPGAANGAGDPTLPCRILSLIFGADGEAVLSWTAVPGKAYRLQYKNDLRDANWMEDGETIATGVTASATNVIPGHSQRFYRVQSIP